MVNENNIILVQLRFSIKTFYTTVSPLKTIFKTQINLKHILFYPTWYKNLNFTLYLFSSLAYFGASRQMAMHTHNQTQVLIFYMEWKFRRSLYWTFVINQFSTIIQDCRLQLLDFLNCLQLVSLKYLLQTEICLRSLFIFSMVSGCSVRVPCV